MSRIKPRLTPFLALTLVASCSAPGSPPEAVKPTPSSASTSPAVFQPRALEAKVAEIVDGDTARMNSAEFTNERVRFIGMDTPERGRPYFNEASGYASTALLGKQVYLEFDVERRDRFGRLLAYVWLVAPGGTDEADVRANMFNALAVLDGYAAILTVPPNVRYVELFTKFQTEAREAERGLWGLADAEPGPAPPNGNCDGSYPDVCIPPPPPDLDCPEIAHRNFRVLPPDPHRFDGNKDGFGCES